MHLLLQEGLTGVSSVGNLAHVHFASSIFSLPLKTEENPHGIFTEHEMFQIMAVIFTAIFFDVDPSKSFTLRHKARAAAQKLGKIVEANVKKTQSSGILSSLFDPFRANGYPLQEYGIHMIWRLSETGLGPSEITYSQVLPTAVAMVPNQAQVFTQIIDYYLSDAGKKHLVAINRIAKEDSPKSDEMLLRYCMEAIRLHGTFGSYRESKTHVTLEDRGRRLNIKPGEKVFISFVSFHPCFSISEALLMMSRSTLTGILMPSLIPIASVSIAPWNPTFTMV